MANINITITNLPQIKAAFRQAPALMAIQLNLAIKKSLITIQAESMRNTPVDTGVLRASTRSLFGELKGEVGTHTNYDVFVHDGTRYMQARPYLFNAVRDKEAETNVFFKQAVDNVLGTIGKAV